MPIWSEILAELSESGSQNEGRPNYDAVRRTYLTRLYQHTERNIILYASGWLQKEQTPALTVSINDEDIQALMEVIQGLKGNKLDLILHSPGGSLEATEAIVSYLRSRFADIRVIVPQLAMSAATMIACSANHIMLGKHSFLGPTDPQILISTPLGARQVAAQAIVDQFDRAVRECKDPAKLSAWLPMLNQYGPDLLERCEKALAMSKSLVEAWLETYMFHGEANGTHKAEQISEWLADHKHFKSHNRHIPRDMLKKQQLKVLQLEDDEKLQDLCLSVFHATTHTFTGTPAVKIVENHTGRAFIKSIFSQPAQGIQVNLDPVLAPERDGVSA